MRGLSFRYRSSFSDRKSQRASMRSADREKHADDAGRKTERRLRTFFNESRDMIYSSNADDVIAMVNSRALELLGYSDRFDVIGRRFSDFVLNASDREHFLSRVRADGHVRDYEVILRRPDGSTRFCLESANLIVDPEDGTVELQGMIKDITERIANERAMWEKNLELAEANQELRDAQAIMVQHEKLASIGQLAAGIAHEINNPLGFLKSNHGALERFIKELVAAWSDVEEAAPEAAERIGRKYELEYVLGELRAIIVESDEGYARIMAIVQALKNFARQEASVLAAYDMNAGVEGSLTMAANEIKYAASVVRRLGNVPAVEAYGNEVNQVILNLVVNAAQAVAAAHGKDKGTIRVTTERRGDRVALCVDDDGPGVPPDIRARIFDPFFTTKAPGKGTGLGLSISYEIVVRKHGGSLYVEDSELGGARFVMELPLRQPVDQADAPPG